MDQNPQDHRDNVEKEVNWLELPNDVLSLISNKLIQIYDYIYFGSVCHPFHSIYTANRHLIPRQLPFLMITTEFNFSDHQTRSLYSITDDYFFNFQLPVPQDRIIVGSTYGWLVTTNRGNLKVTLFNPFLQFNNLIHLPDLPPNNKFEAYQHCRDLFSGKELGTNSTKLALGTLVVRASASLLVTPYVLNWEYFQLFNHIPNSSHREVCLPRSLVFSKCA
ncbi:hypothetical protein FRX31_008851 [Thalictrum thalictroides]|uniref:F-box protein n=1 Tax=Thalictrum thalictroides TaxID=46969 RepID=A0A7J6WZM0_THATH|nr:hypothetical protein FRX31_008851 [Thalictrum thalictroides]